MAKGMNIKEKIASSLLDAFLNPLLAWFTEQAADNIPITMDAAKAKALELFHSFSNDTPEQQEIIVNYAGAFMDGVKCGEQRKETAMIEGMKNAGLSAMQIQYVLLQAQETLVRMGTDDLVIPQPVALVTKTTAKKRKRSR